MQLEDKATLVSNMEEALENVGAKIEVLCSGRTENCLSDLQTLLININNSLDEVLEKLERLPSIGYLEDLTIKANRLQEALPD